MQKLLLVCYPGYRHQNIHVSQTTTGERENENVFPVSRKTNTYCVRPSSLNGVAITLIVQM